LTYTVDKYSQWLVRCQQWSLSFHGDISIQLDRPCGPRQVIHGKFSKFSNSHNSASLLVRGDHVGIL